MAGSDKSIFLTLLDVIEVLYTTFILGIQVFICLFLTLKFNFNVHMPYTQEKKGFAGKPANNNIRNITIYIELPKLNIIEY